MSLIQSLFATQLYRAEMPAPEKLNQKLEDASLALSEQDEAGIAWCEKHGYGGYTSFASIPDLSNQLPVFALLVRKLDGHAAAFAKALNWNIRGGKPVCDSLWVNVLREGGAHTSHIHTNSVLSGTYYVAVPEGAGPIVFEDPRHVMMMAAPPRLASAPAEQQSYFSQTPQPGTVMLWESWLRHEVPVNKAEGLRISVSFNYVIGQR